MVAGSSALSQLQGHVFERHQYAREWQARTGGKVVGVLCSYVPEEVLYAAGLLAVRVLPDHVPEDITDAHISGNFCSYCRGVLASGLTGKYDYLSGLVLSHICVHIMQSYHSWQAHRPTEFAHLLWMPAQIESQGAGPFFLRQMRTLREAVEAWVGRPISDAALNEAIAVHDENRRLLRRLYERRKAKRPPLSGKDALAAVIASTFMDKADHNRLLEGLLAEQSEPTVRPLDGVRVMVVGSENDDLEMIDLIESSGAVVVVEDSCLGSRYFAGETGAGNDPLERITARYLAKPPCPLLDIGARRRGEYLLGLASEYRAEGVIFLHQKFCDPHGWELPVLQPMFEAAGLPCLTLELNFTVPYGQYRTRVEAFVELFN